MKPMSIIIAEKISKSYGDKLLFTDIDLTIEEGEKLCLLGINGTGKSTLLQIIAGSEEADSGRITRSKKIRIEYLGQNPEYTISRSILEEVLAVDTPLNRLLLEYDRVLEKNERFPEQKEYQEEIIRLSQKVDELEGWKTESEAKTVLSKLGLNNYRQNVLQLSGGEKKRVALAAAILNPADLLILDEPTNHLDYQAISWLEEYLIGYKKALLMVTHDRYFLDRVGTRILELSEGEIYSYQGNYSTYLEKKLLREEQEEASRKKRENLWRNELKWVRRGALARSTKQKARLQRFEALSQEIHKHEERDPDFAVASARMGKKVLELENVSKSIADAKCLEDFSYLFGRNDRIGILGLNGMGKTTLLNLIAGELLPDSGTIERGQTVKIGYYTQEETEIEPDIRVIDYIQNENNAIKTADGKQLSASQMLENFLFSPQAQYNKIFRLSGGEKKRLRLLKVLAGSPNLLLLDEPTNDLDVFTLSILEEYLDSFPGAIVIVSHDRFFLERVADRYFVFRAEGKIEIVEGSLEEFLEKNELKSISEKSTQNKKKTPAIKEQKPKKRVLTYKENQELNLIEDKISDLERELISIAENIYSATEDYQLLNNLCLEQAEKKVELEKLYERWEFLSEKA